MRFKLLVLLGSLAAVGCVEDDADRLMRQQYPADSAGAAVAVVRNGQMLYSRTFGLAEIEHRVPVSKDTVFDGASSAKQFTAFALLTLVRDGLVKLDDPIDPFVSKLFPAAVGKGITIRHLVSHTSGIRDYVWASTTAGRRFDDVQTTANVRRFLERQAGFDSTPGAEWVYNNTGYFLLASIIEQVSNKKFVDYMRDAVFAPLGMANTSFLDSPTRIVPNRASAYGAGGEFCYGSAPTGQLVRCINATAIPGPMSLMTTLPDMTTWLIKVQQGLAAGDLRFVQLFAASTTLKPPRTDCGPSNSVKAGYGAGMYLDEIGGISVTCHGGTWRGFRVLELFVPDRKIAVVILSNRGDALDVLRDTAFALIRLFEPATTLSVPPATPPSAPSCSAAPTADVEGTYYSKELETTYTFKRDTSSGHLWATSLRRDNVELCHSAGDTFSGKLFWLAEAKFSRDQDGKVAAVEISALTAASRMVFTKLE